METVWKAAIPTPTRTPRTPPPPGVGKEHFHISASEDKFFLIKFTWLQPRWGAAPPPNSTSLLDQAPLRCSRLPGCSRVPLNTSQVGVIGCLLWALPF